VTVDSCSPSPVGLPEGTVPRAAPFSPSSPRAACCCSRGLVRSSTRSVVRAGAPFPGGLGGSPPRGPDPPTWPPIAGRSAPCCWPAFPFPVLAVLFVLARRGPGGAVRSCRPSMLRSVADRAGYQRPASYSRGLLPSPLSAPLNLNRACACLGCYGLSALRRLCLAIPRVRVRGCGTTRLPRRFIGLRTGGPFPLPLAGRRGGAGRPWCFRLPRAVGLAGTETTPGRSSQTVRGQRLGPCMSRRSRRGARFRRPRGLPVRRLRQVTTTRVQAPAPWVLWYSGVPPPAAPPCPRGRRLLGGDSSRADARTGAVPRRLRWACAPDSAPELLRLPAPGPVFGLCGCGGLPSWIRRLVGW